MNTALIWFLVVILLGVLGGLLVGLKLAGTRAVIECYIPDMPTTPARFNQARAASGTRTRRTPLSVGVGPRPERRT
jgi:hypothetical protein